MSSLAQPNQTRCSSGGQVRVSGLRSTYHSGLIRSGVVNQNGRPENLACRLAAPKIVSPVIAPNIEPVT